MLLGSEGSDSVIHSCMASGVPAGLGVLLWKSGSDSDPKQGAMGEETADFHSPMRFRLEKVLVGQV